ncbi:hypothetical protein BJV78DRAFT_868413 [Lactifluus subvellereus]|nr:hypothetical protein BJV78DRAFT_868413 [Lactifluus subvellereus]
MSWQPPALSATRAQRARIVNGYTSHPDFHLVAAFFLGWVFLSSLRHVWFSAFVRDLMWSLKRIFGRLQGRADGSPMCPQREKPAGTSPSSFHAEDLNRCEQRDTLLVLLLCLG